MTELYTIEVLKAYCEKFQVELSEPIESYEGIHKKSLLKGRCKTKDCSKTFERRFHAIIRNGAYCRNCLARQTMTKEAQWIESRFNEEAPSEKALTTEFSMLLVDPPVSYDSEPVKEDSLIILTNEKADWRIELKHSILKQWRQFKHWVNPKCLK